MYLGHELEVVRPERAGDPQLRLRPVPAWLAMFIDRDPVRVGVEHILVDGVRVGARDDHHSLRSTAGHEFAERVAGTEPAAAVVQRDVGWIIGHASAGAEASAIGAGAAEIVEPELRVITPGVILDQRQLRPAHRAIKPALAFSLLRRWLIAC